jgi:hypothetical protein
MKIVTNNLREIRGCIVIAGNRVSKLTRII